MNNEASIAVTGIVRMDNARRSGSICSRTAVEVVAEIIILDPKNNQTKTTGAAITNRTISPEVI